MVFIAPGQAEQILVNLAVNARDAMPTGGSLTIHTKNVEPEEVLQHNERLKPAKQYLVLSIEDTGIGMSDQVKQRIFEPFFTTKPAGKGTGLGLSMCYGVVQQSGGAIRVESQEARGTVFHLYLPCTEEQVALQESLVMVSLKRGGETILLVEDEPLVREMTAEILKTQGYRLLVAQSTQDALRIAETPEIGRAHV